MGDGLRGGDGSLRGVRDGALGEQEPLEDTDTEESRHLRAKRPLLALAELLWAESLGGSMSDGMGSGSIDWLSEALGQLPSSLPSLSFALLSSSCPPLPRSE